MISGKLVKLTPPMEREFESYINEWRETGETIVPLSSDPQNMGFQEYLQAQRAFETDEGCPERFVPGTTWFYVDDAGRILGAVNLRHRLNDFLLRTGGHIGYGIRPSERRKGHAARMLALTLERAKEMGIPRVLVTCDKENPGSARTIRKNGGVLENEVPEEGWNGRKAARRLDGIPGGRRGSVRAG